MIGVCSTSFRIRTLALSILSVYVLRRALHELM